MHKNNANIEQEKWNATVENALSAALDAIADTQEDWMTGFNAFYPPRNENEMLEEQLDRGLNAICKDGEQYQRAWRIFHDNLPAVSSKEEHHRSTFMETIKSIPSLFRKN